MTTSQRRWGSIFVGVGDGVLAVGCWLLAVGCLLSHVYGRGWFLACLVYSRSLALARDSHREHVVGIRGPLTDAGMAAMTRRASRRIRSRFSRELSRPRSSASRPASSSCAVQLLACAVAARNAAEFTARRSVRTPSGKRSPDKHASSHVGS
jgi:hypothetical protein